MLEIQDLRYGREGFSVNLEMTLPGGAYGILLGGSGSGKTTALRMIAGLIKPDSGRIALDGEDIGDLPPEKRGIGFVFQGQALFSHLSVARNIEYGPRLRGMPAEERHALARETARSLKIESLLPRRTYDISGGEAQRVALARSLAHGPRLLLLDEPLSSLDPSLRKELRAELAERIKGRGLSALHVTHDLEEALSLGDLIHLMKDGRIIESASPEELYERPRTAFCAAFLGRGLILEAEEGPSPGIASTKLGDFACAEAGPKDARRLYIPFSALSPVPLSSGSAMVSNVLRGRVSGTGYLGARREIRLDVKTRDGGAETTLALEQPASLRPGIGEEMTFHALPEACRMLSDA